MQLLVASGNAHKVAEIAELLQGSGWQVLSLQDFPDLQLPPEDAPDFVGNAALKARAGAAATGLWTLADDSGLAVDYLHGAPGVYSARYAGEQKDDEANNRKLLAAMQDCPLVERTARFICALVLAGPTGQQFATEGRCEGRIAYSGCGELGFGYDPLFLLGSEGERTMAELEMAEKNRISHRAAALATMLPILQQVVSEEIL